MPTDQSICYFQASPQIAWTGIPEDNHVKPDRDTCPVSELKGLAWLVTLEQGDIKICIKANDLSLDKIVGIALSQHNDVTILDDVMSCEKNAIDRDAKRRPG